MAGQEINIDDLIGAAKAAQAAAAQEADAAAAALASQRAGQQTAADVQNIVRRAAAVDPQLEQLERFLNTQISKYMAGDKTVTVANLKSIASKYNNLADQKKVLLDQAKARAGVPVEPTPAPTAAPAAAGKGTVTSAQRRVGADVTPTAAPKAPAAPTPTGTTPPTPKAGTGTPKPAAGTTGAGATNGGATGGAGKGKTPTGAAGLTEAQTRRLGTYGSQYLIDYFKNNTKYTVKDPYTGKETSIYQYLQNAAVKGEDANNVSNVLAGSNWYKDVNERYKATIYAYGKANGIELAESQIENYRDQFLGKVKSLEEINYDLGQQAIVKYQLNNTKPEIAKLISAGKSFSEAASDYLSSYAEDLGLAASQVSVSDSKFLGLLNSSVSLDDFKKKTRTDPRFLEKPDSQQAIAANVATLQQKYARYGITLDPIRAQNLGEKLFLGDTSINVIEDGLRKDAAGIFTPFRDRILAGEDPLTIATPYISAMERILEIPGGSLGLNDGKVRSAMMGATVTKGDTTTHSAIPLWQFEQSLYKDDRWQYTDNAHKTMDGITLDVLSRFGLIG